MPVTASQAADFARYARKPETWAIAARRQLAVAMHLFKHAESLHGVEGHSFEEMSGSHYSAYLHAGFAVENAAKAALVKHDPAVITDDGTINRSKFGPNAGHGLLAMAQSVAPSLSTQDVSLLQKLQDFVVWAGRYTVLMSAEALFDEQRMDRLRLAEAGERERIAALVAQLLHHAGLRA